MASDAHSNARTADGICPAAEICGAAFVCYIVCCKMTSIRSENNKNLFPSIKLVYRYSERQNNTADKKLHNFTDLLTVNASNSNTKFSY